MNETELNTMTNGQEIAQPLWIRLKRALGMKVTPFAQLPPLDESGAAPIDPRSMFGRLVDFASLRVDDVMVPRADIEAIAETASVRELLERFAEVGHSRLPVYRETLDDLAGMVHIKDFTAWVVKKAQPRKRAKTKAASENAPAKAADLELKAVDLNLTVKQAGILREILFVPPSMPAADLLVKMQSTHIHMAVVVDEYGGTDGLVSIEDLVEQIVGDIADEHDEGEETLIRPLSDGIYVADARALVEEVERLAGTSLVPEEHEEDVDTLGGLVVAMLGRVPVRGELIKHPTGIEFEVTDADPRRLRKLRIHLKPSGRPAASASERKASA
jgi:CBS domain containing-hemolysin-like protein